MARISFPVVESGGVRTDLVDRVVAERGSLLNLYRLLLHSPGAAEGWLRLGTAIGTELAVSHRIRELVVCAVAASVGAEYEWEHHAPAARACGVTDDQLAGLVAGDWSMFGPCDRAVLAFVDGLGREPAEAAQLVEALTEWFDDREILEMSVVTGFYWMVTRVTIGLAVDRDRA